MGDFFTKPTVKGGLGLGTYGVSAVLGVILVAGIAWVTAAERRRRAVLIESTAPDELVAAS